MKNLKLINQLDKAFENKVRLGIMSLLILHESLDFKSIKKELGISDGNLASHIKALSKKSYIRTRKQFINNKPNTSYSLTENGRIAFENHLNILEEIIKQSQ